ncbi:MAG: hypothetical protein U0807_09935 [Candidatus Binatia bacterium]
MRKMWTVAETAPLDQRIVGRTLFHAALVSVGADFAGALFVVGLEYVLTRGEEFV